MSNVYIYRPSSTRFIGQVRCHGHKRWTSVGPERRSLAPAIKDMARKFSSSSIYKRGRVIMIADYYDPSLVVEMSRT